MAAQKNVLDDVKGFLDELQHELTVLHVHAVNLPGSPQEVTSIPARLIDRAQGLASQVKKQQDAEKDEASKGDAKSK